MFKHVMLENTAPELEQVSIDDKRFYLTGSGEKFPSITTVLSENIKGSIIEWRRRVGEEKANEVTRKATTRGKWFHTACENFLNNEEVKYKTFIQQEQFNIFKPVLSRINNIHALEKRMFSRQIKVAGQVDCVAEFDNNLSIIDFKTSSRPKEKEYIDNYFMQCTAYSFMFQEMYGINVETITVLISVDGSEPQVFIEKRDNYIQQLLECRKKFNDKYNI